MRGYTLNPKIAPEGRSIDRRSTRPLALGLGLILLLSVWALHVGPAGAAPTTPVCPNPPGSPCQAFFHVNASTGAITAAIPLMGQNQEGADYDGVECRGAPSGQCFLAADHSGFSLLNLNAFNCDPSANETPLGNGTSLTVVGLAYDTANGTLYTVDVDGKLYSVDKSTGAVSQPIATGLKVGTQITTIGYDAASNKIYVAQDSGDPAASYELIRFDPSTGAKDASYGVKHLALDGVGNNEILGLAAVGSTLYATTANHKDENPHLATINTTSGTVTDIGAMNAAFVVGLAADPPGNLYALAGTLGATITPFPCPSSPGPSPSTPGPSPSTPGPTPSTPGPSPSTPGPTPSTPGPSPTSVLPTQFIKSPSPGTSVLGLSVSRKPILPVTGSNSLPLVLFAGVCYLFGAVALKVASRRKPVNGSPEDRD